MKFDVYFSRKHKTPVWSGDAESREDAIRKAIAAGKLKDGHLKSFQNGVGPHVVQRRDSKDHTDWRHVSNIDTSPFTKKESKCTHAEGMITVKTGQQGALSINGKFIGQVERMGSYTFVMLDRTDGDRERLTVPDGNSMMASEIAAWVQDYLNKNPKMVADLKLESARVTAKDVLALCEEDIVKKLMGFVDSAAKDYGVKFKWDSTDKGPYAEFSSVADMEKVWSAARRKAGSNAWQLEKVSDSDAPGIFISAEDEEEDE